MRYISLLEFQPGLAADIMAPSSYLERTNGSLAQETCRLIIDKDGFMISDNPAMPGDKKIMLLGGSAIENLYIPAGDRIIAHIERGAAAFGKQAKVYNAGISNAHLLHIINILLNKGLALRPDCIVYYPTPGLDIIANEVENAFWNPRGGLSPLCKSGQEKKTEFLNRFSGKNGFADEKKLLKTLYDICKNFGMPLLIATWPLYGEYDAFMLAQLPDRTAFEQEEAQTAALNDLIRAFCHENDNPLIDLARSFADLDHGIYFYDWNHPNVRGCALIGSLTGQALQPYL